MSVRMCVRSLGSSNAINIQTSTSPSTGEQQNCSHVKFVPAAVSVSLSAPFLFKWHTTHLPFPFYTTSSTLLCFHIHC